jgi:hypothetical protein
LVAKSWPKINPQLCMWTVYKLPLVDPGLKQLMRRKCGEISSFDFLEIFCNFYITNQWLVFLTIQP